MKKLLKLFFISVCLIALPFSFVISSFAIIRNLIGKPFYYAMSDQTQSSTRYAYALGNCYLYISQNLSDTSFQNVLFIVPETYFVEIVDDSASPSIKVKYDDYVGYVAFDTIKEVDFTPKVVTLKNITFDVLDEKGTQLRTSPVALDNNTSILIHKGTRRVTYIASTYGIKPSGGNTNIWYYAIYVPESDPTSVYEGYVYSEKVTNLTPITLNEEGIVPAPPAVETTDNDDVEAEQQGYSLNNTIKIVLIVMICLPIVLVFILLLVSNRKNNNKKLEKQLQNELSDEKPKHEPKAKSRSLSAKALNNSKIRKLEDLDGQELKRKPVFYTNFLENGSTKTVSASLKPEFPSYEVVDDDDLL